MSELREQGWLQKIIEDADKRVNDWPDWKKELEVSKSHASGEEPSDSDDSEGESQSQQAHS